MATKFGTVFARADFENENQNHNDLRTKNDRKEFLSPYGSDLYSRHTQGRFLEHATRGHFDTLKAQELELGVGWVVLNDGVTILICEDREVILRA